MEIDLGSFQVRSFRPQDAATLRQAADNPKVAENLRDAFPSPYSLRDAEEFLAKVTQEDPESHYAIAIRGRVIGAIGLEPQSDVYRRSAELGFFLAESFWGRGMMTAVVRAVVEDAFRRPERSRLVRIFAHVFESNPASARVLEKAGFRREGTLHKAVVKSGRLMDQHLFARLRDGI